MSANLLDGITPTLVNGASSSDDVISIAANAGGERNVVKYAISGLEVLSVNQTMHIGISLRAESGGDEWTSAVVVYRDSANNFNARSNSVSLTGDGAWHRHSISLTVPSGMTIVGINFNQKASGTAIDFANPCLSYGSTGIVMAAGYVTVASINDVASTTRWYMLQSSTLTVPDKPTANPPGGSWSTTEPTYTEGSTNSLYTCDQTVFSDGTWAYSSVSLSTSYEAAKAAYNKAVAAAAAAATTAQHFWADDSGAHISSTGDHDTNSFHQLMTSVKNAFMHGTTELMTISENLIELGKNSASSIIRMCGGKVAVSAVPDAKDRYTGILSGDYGAKIRSANGTVSVGVDGFQNLISMVSGYLQFDDYADTLSRVPMRRFATAIQPVVLYNGGADLTYDTAPGAGTNGNVTLSETAANFKSLMVLYHDDQNVYGSRECPFPDGNQFSIEVNHVGGANTEPHLYATKIIHPSGTSIGVDGYFRDYWVSGTHYQDNNNTIIIIRVEGRR